MLIFMSIYALIVIAYAVIIIRFNKGLKQLPEQSRNIASWPSVSVVVALKNEAVNIKPLLQSISELDYPKELLEVIMIDDHSTDDSLEVLKQFNIHGIRVVTNTGAGKKKAIETGINLAKGNWIAVTDADCTVPKLWLKSMFKYSLPTHKLILGPVGIDANKPDFSSLQTIEFAALQGATAGAVGLGEPLSANGANMLFEKNTFNELKPYANNYHIPTGDDQFLLLAMMRKYPGDIGYALNAGAAIKTNPVDSFTQYFSQRSRWASKAGAIKNSRIQFIGLVTFLMSLMVVALIVSGIYTQNYWLIFLAVTPKLIIDLWLVLPMKKVLKFNWNTGHYLTSSVIYPFVVTLTVIKGLIKSY